VAEISAPGLSSFAELVVQSPIVRLASGGIGIRHRDEHERVALDLPFEQLSIFARRYETSAALARMPIYAIAALGDLDAEPIPAHEPTRDGDDHNDDDERTPPRLEPVPVVHQPLGLLGTDHVGYASFDLGVLRTERTLEALRRAGVVRPGREVRIGLRHLWVMPFADPLLIIDALREGDIGPSLVALRIDLDDQRVEGRQLGAPMTSMQDPGILDWRMSPGSFTLAGALLVGEDGCETLLPTNLATQRWRFAQVARVANTLWERRSDETVQDQRGVSRVIWEERYRLGRIFEYTTEWFPMGHSLGQLAYSLPLAPGEVVKIAVLDWSRSDAGTRDEATSLSESLVHDQVRDRSLTESVHALLDEWQRGGTFMGGVAASGGMGGGGMGLGGAASLGGAYTTSSGTRNLTADTSQRIADAFHQASSALRELRSTVVVQTEQQEGSQAQTRVVANYNHSHALTLLYYEVLRHFRVVTRLATSRPALLVDFHLNRTAFRDEGTLLAHRAELEAGLLDRRLLPAFDALDRVRVGRAAFEASKTAPKPPGPGDAWIDRMQITIATGGAGGGGTDGDPYIDLKLVSGATVETHQIEPNDTSNPRLLGHPGYDDFEDGDKDTYGLKPQAPLKWADLRGFVVGLDGGGDWRIDHLKLEGFTLAGDPILLHDAAFGRDLPNDTETTELLTLRPPAGPAPPGMESFVAPADLQAVDLLARHLEAHRHHYDRLLWLGEDPNDRAVRFEHYALDGTPLLELIENRAIEVSGDWVAFPLAADDPAPGATPSPEALARRAFDAPAVDVTDPTDEFIEQLLTLPSRGVFAEAKLGHCNASEFIDPMRFWDWQTSPIPHQAPDIAPVDTGSRAKDVEGLKPTAFPNSLVNIVNPQALPDPTGLAAALKVLGTPEIFRDMSAKTEVGSLLEKLSDNATAMASQGMRSSARQDLLRDIRGANELSDGKRAGLVEDLLRHDVGGLPEPGKGTPPAGGGATTPTGAGATTPPGGSTTPAPIMPKAAGPTIPPKPKLPTPPPAAATRGLAFALNFQRVKVGTTAVGRATITVRGAADAEAAAQLGYVPGVTIGPPTDLQGEFMPETWNDMAFFDGGLVLRSQHTRAPGRIHVVVSYEMGLVNRADLVAGAFIAESAPFDIDPVDGTFTMVNGTDYKPPASGDTVMLTIVPHIETVTLTVSSSDALSGQIASKIGGAAILSAEVTSADSETTGTTTTRTVALAYLTGGLDFTQVM
jgi:hypothetical protein